MSVRFANLIFISLKKIVKNENNLPREELLDRMQETVMAIPRHYCDYPEATKVERMEMHVLCNPEWCDYYKDPENYKVDTPQCLYIPEINTTNEPCNDAIRTIVDCFDNLAARTVMERLTLWLSQNSNESIHNRLFHIISKTKWFEFNHVNFAAYLTATIHNVGYEGTLGKIHSSVGVYYNRERKHLQSLDKDRIRQSLEHHQKAKQKSRYGGKPPLKPEEIHYSAGYAFEDHDIEGVAQFEESLARRAAVEKDLERDEQE